MLACLILSETIPSVLLPYDAFEAELFFNHNFKGSKKDIYLTPPYITTRLYFYIIIKYNPQMTSFWTIQNTTKKLLSTKSTQEEC